MFTKNIYKGMPVFIDNDENLGYEFNGILKKILHFFLISILNRLPSSFQKHIKKTHKSAAEVIEHATTHIALEVLYQRGKTHKLESISQTIMHRLWFGLNNVKAVNNRLKLIKKEINLAVHSLAEFKNEIKILSIASGSARAIIETLSSINLPSNKRISVTFIDKNPEAIEYSKMLATNFSKIYDLRWVTDTAGNFPKYYKGSGPDIIEMVGLLDYFDEVQSLKILSLIFHQLQDGGFLITANIMHNDEEKFISNTVGWKMKYKTLEDLIHLALAAGFHNENIKIICEPLKIHAVLVAIK